MATTTTLLTVDEYLKLPPREDDLRDELIEGEIVLSPSAKPLHARVVRRITKLIEPVEALGYEIGTDFGCRLGEHSLPGPDIGVVQAERWNNIPEDEYLIGSPELVVEIFSPSNRKALLAQKAGLYLQHGAEAVWIVYPKRRTVMVHDAEGEFEARLGETVTFHGVTIPMSSIFEGL
jgi:Uma2 family endonuclease